MGIHLFEHNQSAYNAAVMMLEEEGMAAVIHPTGTGKSLIAFKLVEDHPAEQFLWLSPSEYIFQTQLENLGMKFTKSYLERSKPLHQKRVLSV